MKDPGKGMDEVVPPTEEGEQFIRRRMGPWYLVILLDRRHPSRMTARRNETPWSELPGFG
jgi:hypothetical protein